MARIHHRLCFIPLSFALPNLLSAAVIGGRAPCRERNFLRALPGARWRLRPLFARSVPWHCLLDSRAHSLATIFCRGSSLSLTSRSPNPRRPIGRCGAAISPPGASVRSTRSTRRMWAGFGSPGPGTWSPAIRKKRRWRMTARCFSPTRRMSCRRSTAAAAICCGSTGASFRRSRAAITTTCWIAPAAPSRSTTIRCCWPRPTRTSWRSMRTPAR
jgi:hypothetical protein